MGIRLAPRLRRRESFREWVSGWKMICKADGSSKESTCGVGYIPYEGVLGSMEEEIVETGALASVKGFLNVEYSKVSSSAGHVGFRW